MIDLNNINFKENIINSNFITEDFKEEVSEKKKKIKEKYDSLVKSEKEYIQNFILKQEKKISDLKKEMNILSSYINKHSGDSAKESEVNTAERKYEAAKDYIKTLNKRKIDKVQDWNKDMIILKNKNNKKMKELDEKEEKVVEESFINVTTENLNRASNISRSKSPDVNNFLNSILHESLKEIIISNKVKLANKAKEAFKKMEENKKKKEDLKKDKVRDTYNKALDRLDKQLDGYKNNYEQAKERNLKGNMNLINGKIKDLEEKRKNLIETLDKI